MIFVTEFDSKKNMYQLFNAGYTSGSFKPESKMYLAMYAYETYGDATRDNTFDDLVQLGKELENKSEGEL